MGKFDSQEKGLAGGEKLTQRLGPNEGIPCRYLSDGNRESSASMDLARFHVRVPARGCSVHPGLLPDHSFLMKNQGVLVNLQGNQICEYPQKQSPIWGIFGLVA